MSTVQHFAQGADAGTGMIGEYLLGAVFLLFLYLWTTGKLYGKPAVDLIREAHAQEVADLKTAHARELEAWREDRNAWRTAALNGDRILGQSVQVAAQVVQGRSGE